MFKYINTTDKKSIIGPIKFDRSYRVIKDTFVIGYVYRGKTTFMKRIGYRNYRRIFWFAKSPDGVIAVGKTREKALYNLFNNCTLLD